MQEVALTVRVQTNISTTPDEIARVVMRLISIGMDDAAATIEDGDLDETCDAQLALGLIVRVSVVAKSSCLLVVVRGGVADVVGDEGADVEIFDWGNYRAEGEAVRRGVAAHFADLAVPIGVPVEPA